MLVAVPVSGAVLVDDDPAVLNLISEVLKHSGVDIETYSDPRKLEGDLDELPAGVFIVDLHMPELDGYELIRRLRAHPRHKQTPIVVVTGTIAPEAIERCFALGADDFVAKPFLAKALMARVNRLLRRDH